MPATLSAGHLSRVLSRITFVTMAVAMAAPCPQAVAQDGLRSFVGQKFDTDALRPGIDDLDASGGVPTAMLVVRGDQVLALGNTQATDAPPAPPGTHYVHAELDGSWSNWSGLALRSDGAIVHWGPGTLAPPVLPAGLGYLSLSVAADHAAALRSDGAVVVWGSNAFGQLNLPTLPPGVGVVQVAASLKATLRLRTDGIIDGAGNSPLLTTPPARPTAPFDRIWVGAGHAIARRSNGTFVAWGNNDFGQCDLPPLPSGVTYAQFGLGSNQTVAYRSDGRFLALGQTNVPQPLPVVPAGTSVKTMAATWQAIWILLANGEVLTRGEPGLLGTAEPLPPNTTLVDQVGSYLPKALTAAGEIWQPYADLADFDPALVPPLPPGVTYVAIDSAANHTVALRSDGRAVAWGNNDESQCALPPLPPGITYTAVSTSWRQTALLRSDGRVVVCGHYSLPPFTAAGGHHYVQVAADFNGLALLRDDGVVEVIGGQNPSQQANVPPLPAGVRFVQVAMMRSFCAALRSDGNTVVWGSANLSAPPLPAGAVCVQVDGQGDAVAMRFSDGTVITRASGQSPPAQQPRAGASFVDMAAGYYSAVARYGPTCTYVAFANGCAGTLPAARIVPRDTPRIGRAFKVTLFDLPEDLALLVTGAETPTPVPLAVLGMPGCEQHVALDAAIALVGTDGIASFTFPVPNVPVLVGATFAQQAVVFDSQANAAGLVVSQATRGVIGRR